MTDKKMVGFNVTKRNRSSYVDLIKDPSDIGMPFITYHPDAEYDYNAVNDALGNSHSRVRKVKNISGIDFRYTGFKGRLIINSDGVLIDYESKDDICEYRHPIVFSQMKNISRSDIIIPKYELYTDLNGDKKWAAERLAEIIDMDEFRECLKDKIIDDIIGNNLTDDVEKVSNMFNDIDKLTSINGSVVDGWLSNFKVGNKWFYYRPSNSVYTKKVKNAFIDMYDLPTNERITFEDLMLIIRKYGGEELYMEFRERVDEERKKSFTSKGETEKFLGRLLSSGMFSDVTLAYMLRSSNAPYVFAFRLKEGNNPEDIEDCGSPSEYITINKI